METNGLRFFMLKKLSLLLLGLCLILQLNCERNNNPVSADDQDTSDVVVRKPNIYIYPIQTLNLTIKLVFPQGGSILESIPFYNGIWNIEVDPSGLIDNQYTYLYYECKIADRFNYESGWVVDGNQLEDFFKSNLSKTGFIETEIQDFIDYWIPKLESTNNYLIYPQYNDDIDPLIDVQCSKEPDCVLRLFYVIETKNPGHEAILSEPIIPEFKRKGFTIVEWGVILK